MTKIKRYVDGMKDELCGAKDYAESYIECKAAGNMDRAKIYYQMAQDELKHADNLHNIAVQEINALKEAIEPPESMLDKWRDAHGYFVEKAAWVKQMLSL